MSPRAAWRLETLGFTRVIDYTPGKQAWFGQNLPREGKAKDDLWIGDLADAEVPTCSLAERIGSIRERVRASGWETCVVVNDDRIVLGLLRRRQLDSNPEVTAEAVMAPGPKTFRPNVTLTELVESMRRHDIKTNSLVTTNEGKLIGVISRDDAEATLAHEAEHTEHGDVRD
jgi:CBS domain-containing protein